MASVVRATALRAGGACVRCRKGKTKCVYENGRAPCKNCAKGMHDCYLPSESMSHGGHGVSPARVPQRSRESLPSDARSVGPSAERNVGGQGGSSASRHTGTTSEKYVLVLIYRLLPLICFLPLFGVFFCILSCTQSARFLFALLPISCPSFFSLGFSAAPCPPNSTWLTCRLRPELLGRARVMCVNPPLRLMVACLACYTHFAHSLLMRSNHTHARSQLYPAVVVLLPLGLLDSVSFFCRFLTRIRMCVATGMHRQAAGVWPGKSNTRLPLAFLAFSVGLEGSSGLVRCFSLGRSVSSATTPRPSAHLLLPFA